VRAGGMRAGLRRREGTAWNAGRARTGGARCGGAMRPSRRRGRRPAAAGPHPRSSWRAASRRWGSAAWTATRRPWPRPGRAAGSFGASADRRRATGERHGRSDDPRPARA
jgi:hypothetical protein